MKKDSVRKVRINLDVSEQFNNRLEKLIEIVQADTKSSLIRQALQVYEYIAQQTINGYTFKIVKNGQESDLVFLGPPINPSVDQTEENIASRA